MATRYGGIYRDPSAANVASMGSQPGPVGGDGWTLVGRLPHDELPQVNGRLVVLCNMRVGNIRRSGPGVPSSGHIQVCLGTRTGSKSPVHMGTIGFNHPLGPFAALPFQFCVLQSASPSISDPFFGATWDNSQGESGDELAIWARGYWNGDQPAYTIEFAVADIVWLWFDADSIPGADQLAEHYYPGTPQQLTQSLSGIHEASNAPGSEGQQWLHFHNLTYRPRAPLNFAPAFEFGYSTGPGFTNWTPKVGGAGRWGHQKGFPTTSTGTPQHAEGCFWYREQPAGTFLPGVQGRDRVSSPAPTEVVRHCYFGLRLDNLHDVLVRTDERLPQATSNLAIAPFYPLNYTPLERIGAQVTSYQSVFMHGVVETDGHQTFDTVLETNLGRPLDLIGVGVHAGADFREGASAMSFVELGLSRNADDIQYRAHFVGMPPSAPPRSLDVLDFTLVAFNLVRDPSVTPAGPPTAGPPVVLVPGRESAAPNTLPTFPVAPDARMSEETIEEEQRAEIAGSTGYVRTWPLFAQVRRRWNLEWSNLGASDSDTLVAWLVANVAVQWTPPREAAPIAVLQETKPERRQRSGHTFAVTASFVELIWTGGA